MVDKETVIGVVGSGAMGGGIAQVAATAGHKVMVFDNSQAALEKAANTLKTGIAKLVEKQKISAEKAQSIISNIVFVDHLETFAQCGLVIEAVIENSDIKKNLFSKLESIVTENCVLASNTSSLSITSIASACKKPERVLGIHFFNPATLMPLVEIVPGITTEENVLALCKNLVQAWGKVTVIAKDTPGFIVNRVARPFYSEALRIYEEGIATPATIDWAMKDTGGFKMGPFELMDMIGHDVNYVVTETVWKQLYFDPRFTPALSQKRILEAGFLGRKSGRGFYDYSPGSSLPQPDTNNETAALIFNRILAMLINEAANTLYLNIASREDIDLAMTKGVNYPKGLLKWADETGINKIAEVLQNLHNFYEEDRYRVSPMLKNLLRAGKRFYS